MDDTNKNPINHANLYKTSFHKIPQKLSTDLPLEREYQTRNILSIIKEAIEKLKISLILPKIFENPRVLRVHLQDTDYANCLKLVKEYRDERKKGTLDDPPKTDYNLIKIIDYFHENYKILNVLPNWLDDLDNSEKTVLKAFDDIYQLAQHRFYRSAMADLLKEKRLHEVYWANENTKRSIVEMHHKIETKKFNYLWKFAAKNGVIASLEDELAFQQYDNSVLVNKEIAKSTQEVRKINIACIAKQRELEEELEKSRALYDKTLKNDLSQEKLARDEKNKYQLQLKALVTKYDQTILEKHREELFLQEEFEKQKLEFDEFMIEYNREDAIYDIKVRKIRQEEKRLHQAKIVLFTKNRAAKKIQRWIKKILRRMKKPQKKGKGKRGGKGKAAAKRSSPTKEEKK